VVPVPRSKGTTKLLVVSGGFTPPLGWDELTTLSRFAVALGAAMDRVELVEERTAVQRELERSTAQLQEAQRLAHIGSWEWDVSTNRTTWSDELYRVYGVDRATFDPSKDDVYRLIRPDDAGAIREAVDRALETHEPFVTEHRLADPDSDVVIQGRGAVVLNDEGNVARIVGTAQDITEQKRAESSLRAAFEREREAADRLRALDEMKGTFLTAVSHELRTPLTAVAGFAYTLQHRLDSITPEEREEMLLAITRNSRKLEALLTDLLDLDRLERGILEPRGHPQDIAQLVLRTVEQTDIGDEHAVEILAEPVHAIVDGAKVERMVENLLSNSARHTPPGTRIWVRVEREGDQALIVVEDDGPGVPPELHGSIFQPFSQGPSITSHNPGVGIGLSLVSQFARLHGGRAWVEDREGGGASFRVLLPIEPSFGTPAGEPVDDTHHTRT